MKKMLFVASYADSLTLFRGDLIAALVQGGIEVHAAAPGLAENQPLRAALDKLDVRMHDLPMQRASTNPIADACLMWRLFWLMRRVDPDVFLGYTIKPVVYGSVSAWLAHVPRRFAMIEGLGYAFVDGRGGRLRHLVVRMYRFALSRVHRVFFLNPDDLALFREEKIVAHHAPTVLLNGCGVHVGRFPEVPVPRSSMRFLMIGRLLGDKGVREYISAARQIRATHPEVRFGLVGWIDENPDAVDQAELDSWVQEGVIDFHGKLDDVRPVIADSSVYVLPSYREGTPRTVLEAMAMGRAIITTDTPGCKETVVDGENGFLVPSRSVNALVAAMTRFIEDPELALSMGRKSREIAESKYDVYKVNEVMLREMGFASTGEGKVMKHD